MNEGNYSQQLEQHMLGERAALRSDYDALQVSFGNLIATRDSLAQQLEAVNAQAVVHTEHVKSLTATKVQVDILTAQVLNLTQQKDAYRQELDSLDPQLATIDQVLLATDLSQIRTLELDVTALEVELRTIEAELTSITDLKEQISLHTAGNTANHWQYAKYLGQVEKLRHVANIFSINGIQKWLFVSALNEISALANSLIRPIGFSIIFQLEKSKKSGEGFKPVFDILVTKTPDNRVLNLEDLSGAEKALVHFSIRLAFSTIIATNHDFRFMIIDEGFGDLDASNREYLANTIKHLSKQYQIFLVTHFPDFESEFPNIMLIERENGVSRIISPQN
jgi:DNA repair exonuclease SbcCD ATPase subunit